MQVCMHADRHAAKRHAWLYTCTDACECAHMGACIRLCMHTHARHAYVHTLLLACPCPSIHPYLHTCISSNAKEFSLCLQHAMAADPAPLTDNDRYRLSWEAATERFYDAAYTGSRKTQPSITDIALARLHRHVAGWDILTGTHLSLIHI